MSLSDEIKITNELNKIAEDPDNPAFKAIFLDFASRKRSLAEMTTDATFAAVERTLQTAKRILSGLDAKKNKITAKEKKDYFATSPLSEVELTELIMCLEKKAADSDTSAKKRLNEGHKVPLLTKKDVIVLFKKLEELGLGKYTGAYARNKARFEWTTSWCNNIGIVALIKGERLLLSEEFDSQDSSSVETVLELSGGRAMLIKLPSDFKKKGKEWKTFLKQIIHWAESELEES